MINNNKVEQKLGLRFYQGGGSSSASSPQATPQQMLQTYSQYLPQILGITSGTTGSTATGLANAANAANPIYTQGTQSQLNNQAGGYVSAGTNLANQQAAGQAGLISGAGGQAATNAVNLNNSLNTAQAGSNALASQLGGAINLNGLSPGEYNATERANNQGLTATGNLGVNNGTNTVANAMNFGGAFNNKIGIASNALGSMTGVANAQNAQVNPVSTATNAGNVSNNFGASLFNPSQANANLTVPYSAASSLGNQVASVSSAQNSSGGSAQGGVCFLTTVACEYLGKEDNCPELQALRNFRDSIVPRELVNEYKRIAPSIVSKVRGVKDHCDYIWSIVQECLKDIAQGYNADAIAKYRIMVTTLQHI